MSNISVEQYNQLIAELTAQFETLAAAVFDLKVREGVINFDSSDMTYEQFKQQYIYGFGATKFVPDDRIRVFQAAKMIDFFATKIADIEAGTFDPTTIKYLTCNVGDPRPTGQIAAAVQNLLVSGAGIKPTVPTLTTATPIDVGFQLSSDILPGQWALNITDNKWYYRKGDTIYEMKSALGLLTSDISGLDAALLSITNDISDLEAIIGAESFPISMIVGLQAALDQFTSDISDLNDDITAVAGDLASHIADTTIHFQVDGSTITIVAGEAVVSTSAIRAMFSATDPIDLTDGAISLKYDTDHFVLDINGKLQLKVASLPIASGSTLGGVKVGAYMTIDVDGVINPALGSGLLLWNQTSGTFEPNASKANNIIYVYDITSPDQPDDAVSGAAYNGTWAAYQLFEGQYRVRTTRDVTDAKMANWDAAYAALTALTPGGYAKSTFTNTDLDASFQYEFEHNLGSDDVAIHVYDSAGQEQPVLKTNSTVNKTIIGCQAAITGTWKVIARL